jgi:hypothetical protein
LRKECGFAYASPASVNASLKMALIGVALDQCAREAARLEQVILILHDLRGRKQWVDCQHGGIKFQREGRPNVHSVALYPACSSNRAVGIHEAEYGRVSLEFLHARGCPVPGSSNVFRVRCLPSN